MRPALWLFLLGILLPCAAAAQETRGNISGTVRDEQGVVIDIHMFEKDIEGRDCRDVVTQISAANKASFPAPR